MAKRNRKSQTVVAEICLYGTQAIGAGWLARTADGRMFGTGEPLAGRSMTAACWLAADELRAAGVVDGLLRIFEPSGAMVATVDLGGLKGRSLPYFGDLQWAPAPVYTISVEALVEAAASSGCPDDCGAPGCVYCDPAMTEEVL